MDKSQLVARLATRLFDRPLIQNSFRGELFEEIVATALEPEWEHCGNDWGSCDFMRRADGFRIQVKQSAVRQSWYVPDGPKARPKFSIARKTGEWVGPDWIDGIGRNADLFIFGLHPVDDESADHRDPDQWLFYVVRETELPNQASMALSTLQRLATPVRFSNLRSTVDEVAVTE